jgi:hypothetical protein
MSIGNDIRPKKIYNLKREHHSVINGEILKEKTDKETDGGQERKKEDFFDEYPESPKKNVLEKNRKKPFFSTSKVIWFLIIALIAIVVYQNIGTIISIYEHKHNPTAEKGEEKSNTEDQYVSDTASNNDNSQSETTAQPSTSVEPAAVVDKSKISIEVLNGNGISGSADLVSEQLKTAGFTVSKVANARKFSYATTIIYYKTGKNAEADLVKTVLTDRESSTENSDALVGSYDIVIVAGKK